MTSISLISNIVVDNTAISINIYAKVSSQQQQQTKPDNSCLFHPEQIKCKPDPITGKCLEGFSMNVNQHCYPNKSCPKGFERHEDDETGACYPIPKPSATK